MSTSPALERFDGEAAWRLLSPEVQLRIGTIAMELGANFRHQDLSLASEMDPRFERVLAAADVLLIGLLTEAVGDALPEDAFLAPDKLTPRIPHLLGGVCRACGCSQNDACDEGCGWAAEDLCTACVGDGEPMPAETHRQACDAAFARAWERHAAEIAAGGTAGIGRRVQLETSAALLRGMADLLDAGLPEVEVWMQTGRALAGGLTAFLMTLHAGDREAVAEDLPGALASVYELALARLSDPSAWRDAPVHGSDPEARH